MRLSWWESKRKLHTEATSLALTVSGGKPTDTPGWELVFPSLGGIALEVTVMTELNEDWLGTLPSEEEEGNDASWFNFDIINWLIEETTKSGLHISSRFDFSNSISCLYEKI